MEITNQGNIDTHAIELLADMWNGLCSLWRIDRDTDKLGASQCQFLDLNCRTYDVGCIRVGHGLNAHRRIATHRYKPITSKFYPN